MLRIDFAESDIPPLLADAVLFHLDQNWVEAKSAYSQRYPSFKEHSGYCHWLGVLYYQFKEYPLARRMGQKSAQLSLTPIYSLRLGLFKQLCGEFQNVLLDFYIFQVQEMPVLIQSEALMALKDLMDFHPDSYLKLGVLQQNKGHFEFAKQCFEQAIKASPTSPIKAFTYLGHLALVQGNSEQALMNYHKALKHGGQGDLYFHCGKIHQSSGNVSLAKEMYDKALFFQPQRPLLLLQSKLVYPPLFDSRFQLEQCSRHLFSQLRKHEGLVDLDVHLNDFARTKIDTLFDWYYHQSKSLPLRKAFEKCFKRLLTNPLPRFHSGDSKPLGIVVTGGHEGAFIHSQSGLIHHLPQDLALVIFCEHQAIPLLKAYLNHPGLEFCALSSDLYESRDLIKNRRCYWLYYWEVGSDPINYILPFYQLAPIQFTSWGTPGTTGISSLQYYLSSELIEPPEAQSLYSENLLLSSGLQMNYPDPLKEAIPKLGRENWGFSENATLYLCPQNIQKIHPDFDRVFLSILKSDPCAEIILIQHRFDAWNQLLIKRLKRSLGGLDRVHFIPRLPRLQFLALIKISDLILDTWYFSAGKLSFECLGLGQLILTWAGPSMRGRITAGCYHAMGLSDLISQSQDHYIEQAIKWGQNRSLRESLKKSISGRRACVVETPQAADYFWGLLQEMDPQQYLMPS